MNVEIAERLAARRKQAGLSQEALAEKLGVSRQAVSKWERSESSPDTDNLIALAKLYGVSLDELLYVDESIEDDVAFEAADRAQARGSVRESAFSGRRVEGSSAAAAGWEAPSADAAAANGDAHAGGNGEADAGTDPESADGGFDFEKEGKGTVHIGFDGINVDDGKDHVHVSWADGVHVVDRYGQEVHVGWDGVRVNATEPGAADHLFTKHPGDRPFAGRGPFKNIDVDYAKKWLKFPFWAIVLVVYLLLGMVSGTSWIPGLFLLFLIPIYYLVGAAIVTGRIAPMLCALYPIGCIAWFLWMVFIDTNWRGPAWVIFLTIPLVEICLVKGSEWWHRRKAA